MKKDNSFPMNARHLFLKIVFFKTLENHSRIVSVVRLTTSFSCNAIDSFLINHIRRL